MSGTIKTNKQLSFKKVLIYVQGSEYLNLIFSYTVFIPLDISVMTIMTFPLSLAVGPRSL